MWNRGWRRHKQQGARPCGRVCACVARRGAWAIARTSGGLEQERVDCGSMRRRRVSTPLPVSGSFPSPPPPSERAPRRPRPPAGPAPPNLDTHRPHPTMASRAAARLLGARLVKVVEGERECFFFFLVLVVWWPPESRAQGTEDPGPADRGDGTGLCWTWASRPSPEAGRGRVRKWGTRCEHFFFHAAPAAPAAPPLLPCLSPAPPGPSAKPHRPGDPPVDDAGTRPV